MKLAIHQPQYMPWLGYCHKMASVDLFVFLDDVQFKKNEWQHRNRIRNAKGWQWLSVPNTYSFPQKINEVAILYQEDWRKKHLMSINSCYGKSRFYHEVIGKISEFFTHEWKTIDAVNIESARLLAGIIGIQTKTVRTSDFSFDGVSTERLVNICRHFGAATYLAGAGGKEYMEMDRFEKAGIAVEFQEFATPWYPQHWSAGKSDFIPGLSALDMVFNCGPGCLDVLMGIHCFK
jgi:hypothetical protein